MPCLKSQEQNAGCPEQKITVLCPAPALATTKEWASQLSQPPSLAPALATTKEWASRLSQPPSPAPGCTPTLIRDKLALLGSKQGKLFFALAPSTAAGTPVKPCLNSLFGL